MELSIYSFADLQAMKGFAKEKENYFKAIQYISIDFTEKYAYWKSLHETFEKELSNRLLNIKF